jgi:hypothetical protein
MTPVNPVPTSVATASIDNDLPSTPFPAATVIGASPFPAAPSASVSAGKAKHHDKKPGAAASAKASSAGLPPGLPQTRSGQ